MKIYTKKGDDGTTGLLFGGRVSKADLRPDAYGTVDTAISAMGMARALSANRCTTGSSKLSTATSSGCWRARIRALACT